MKIATYFALAFPLMAIEAEEIFIRAPDGALLVQEVNPTESFLAVIEQMRNNFGVGGEFLLDFMTISSENSFQKGSKSLYRNYFAAISPSEKEDIRYIVNTLGLANLSKVAKAKSSLERAGKRVDHIHPLQFLTCIFTDEKMKVAIHALQSRSWLWGEFYGGLKNSLEEEFNRNSMPPEIIAHFADQVGVPVTLIYQAIMEKQWSQLLNILINVIPRSGDAGRYNI